MAWEYQNKRIIVWSSICLFWFLITPFAVYYLYIFYLHRMHMQLKKRNYETVLLCSCFCGIFWIFERPLGLIWSSQIWGNSKLFTIIHYIIFPFTIYGLLFAFIWRYWLVYYQVKVASETFSHSKWKSIINKNNIKQNWFLNSQNQSTFGNVKWTFFRFLIIFFIFFIISSIIQILPSFNIYSQTVGVLLDGCLNLLSFSILLIIWFKTPRFEDSFFIRDELRYIIFAYILLYLFYFIGTGINSLINGNYFYLTVFQTYSAVIFTIIWYYLSTRWILRKFNLDTRKETYFTQNENNDIDINNKSVPITHFKMQYSESAMNLKLYQLLESNEGFSCFMNHLIYEFSQECLLSFVEMVQWKKAFNTDLIKFENNQSNQSLDIINDNDIDLSPMYKEEDDVLNIGLEHDKSKTHSMDLPKISTKFKPKLFNIHSNSVDSVIYENDKILQFEFPICVPLSSIINTDISHYDQDDQTNVFLTSLNQEKKLIYQYKVKAHKLYEKYVKCGANFEINIASKQRKKLDDFMFCINDWIKDDIDIDELIDLYDYCIREMYRLMQDSFNRFKQTQRFLDLDKAKLFEKGTFQF